MPKESEVDAFIFALTEIAPDLIMSAHDAKPRLIDWRNRYHGRARAVVRPRNTAQVSAIVKLCHHYRVPFVVQGGNTGLVGGATPSASGNECLICLDRMNQVLSLDAANATLTVESGVVLHAAQEAARKAGWCFPLSLASEASCTIGGNIASNAGGTAVLRYGVMRDLVMGLEVVLPNGDVLDLMRSLKKDNTGYDLKQLFIGAEGTLGVITRAILKLYPAPKVSATALMAAHSPEAVAQLFALLRQEFRDQLSGFEIFSNACAQLVFKHFGTPLPVKAAAWHVLVQLDDSSANEGLSERLEAVLANAMRLEHINDAAIAQSSREADIFWALRENISEAQRLEGASIKHDISLPLGAIPHFLTTMTERIEAAFPGVTVVAFGHYGDGNLHYNVNYAKTLAAQIEPQRTSITTMVYREVMANAGSISAEHGIGQLKREAMREIKSPVELNLMLAVKNAFDPLHLANPEKLLPDIH